MDLELSDEQRLLSESVDELLRREPSWAKLVEFGALETDSLGAIELCLIARGIGAHLASVPFLGSAAVRLAVGPQLAPAFEDEAIALALLEPGGTWDLSLAQTSVEGGVLNGRKVAVEHVDAVQRLAVVASGQALALVAVAAPGVSIAAQPAFDPTTPFSVVSFEDARAAPADGFSLQRLTTIASLLAAAEAIGAAGRLLSDACAYASERKQFGKPIGSFQALRHVMADMYVRQASAWSSVLYAAATLDEDAADAPRTVSIAKAYVSRAAREVAHGAVQVFGGVAITDEHPAHRYLRRIVVREQQFGDAAFHERRLGRALAASAVAGVVA